jgi:hypothetical protein
VAGLTAQAALQRSSATTTTRAMGFMVMMISLGRFIFSAIGLGPLILT